jgi:hypothetical protein
MKAICPQCSAEMTLQQTANERDAICSGCGATLVVPAAAVEPADPALQPDPCAEAPAASKPRTPDDAILAMADDIRQIRNLIAGVLILTGVLFALSHVLP